MVKTVQQEQKIWRYDAADTEDQERGPELRNATPNLQ